MAIYLVTGGAGFIGSHLVEALVKQGETVRVFDNLATGKRENLQPFADHIQFIQGTITDLQACRRAVEGVEYVLHQAALGSVPRSIADPFETNRTNVDGTLNMLVAARDAGVRRLVFAGSSSAYGDTEVSPKHEGLPANPRSPYAVSKVTGENYCKAFSNVYGLDTVTLRYFNVFGPRQDPNSQYAAVIPRFLDALLEGKNPVIYGDGSQSRDFTFVANNVTANLLALKAPGPLKGETLNIACGGSYSLLDLLRALCELTGKPFAPEFAPMRPGDVMHSKADIRRAAERIGYTPQVEFREGIRRTVEWFLEHKPRA